MSAVAEPRTLTAAELDELSASLADAIAELQIQRRRVMERSGSTNAEALDMGRSIERLRTQANLLDTLVAPAEEPPATPESIWSGRAPRARRRSQEAGSAALRQYYVHFWHGISKDQIQYWVFFFGERPPTIEEANHLIERGIKRLGSGYWDLVNDSTFPPEQPLLLREDEGTMWGWDIGEQEERVSIEPGEALARKLKIEDWLEHPEPHTPKEAKFAFHPIEEEH